jgi:hypothetical protein
MLSSVKACGYSVEWSFSGPSHFTPVKISAVFHCVWDWVCPEAGLDTKIEKFTCPLRELKHVAPIQTTLSRLPFGLIIIDRSRLMYRLFCAHVASDIHLRGQSTNL